MLGLFGAALLPVVFLPALQFLLQTWRTVEEYGFGFFVPVIVAFLVWQRRDDLQAQLRRDTPGGAWVGVVLVVAALLMNLLGQLSAIRLFGEYGFVVAVYGLCIAAIGLRATRVIAMPLAFLFLMIPLPQFFLRELSEQLQLVSSELGVAIIRAAGISVFQEGNVIDLGAMQLQVADACSGLRYLFPLLTLGLLAAYFFEAAMWKRAVVVVSTLPFTVGINSLRIGLIGITVEYWGSSMAEGLLHTFEGWFMFMVCIALLIVEMLVLARVGRRVAPSPAPAAVEPVPAPRGSRSLPAPLLAACALLLACALGAAVLPERALDHPPRTALAGFPLELGGGWHGRTDHLDRDVLAALHVDDHLIADYRRDGGPPVNFYLAYYASQSGGESIHSPRTCIPGGGWQIVDIAEIDLAQLAGGAAFAGLHVNRAIIQRGQQRQLVYFWFSQRGRSLTSEYAVKWFILRDGIVRHRSDGALVRLVTPMPDAEPAAAADRRLLDFVAAAVPQLPPYLPG